MRIPESATLRLLDKYGLAHAKYTIVVDQLQLTSKREVERIKNDLELKSDEGKVVMKVDAPVGGKMKSGLMAIGSLSKMGLKMEEMFRQARKLNLEYEDYLVEEFLEHEKEFFLAIKAVREGLQVYFSSEGGVEIEKDWGSVQSYLIPTERVLKMDWPVGEMAELIQPSSVLGFTEELLNLFVLEDVAYLEINPLTVTKEFKVVPLGIVLELDEAAEFRHSDWPEFYGGQRKTERERKVEQIDRQIRGSVKLVEVPATANSQQPTANNKLTAVMGGGAGSVLFLCDAVINNRLQLANYAEFSGNPPNWALTELTKQVCAIPGIKNLVIGSGIANFTPANENIKGIIKAFKESPEAKNLSIVVRRCGPGEEEGVRLMKEFIAESGWKNAQVFDRYTGMTEIVGKLKVKSHKSKV